MTSTLPVKALPNEGFDYSSLDTETLHFVQQQTGEIRALMKRTAQDIIEIGQKLIKVKKRLGYGQYRKWIKAEFNWSKSTANAFEHVAKQFADVQNLDIFAPSALYELAAPSTPKAAREEAITLAKAGERISYTFSKKIKQKHIAELTKSKSESNNQASFSAKTQLKEKNHQAESRKNTSSLSPPDAVSALQPNTQSTQHPAKQAEQNSNSSVSAAKTTAQLSSSQLKPVQSECCWQLGKHHLLYHGDPHSPQFQALLPERIALAVSFPPTASWNLGSLGQKINSSLTLFSLYEDIALKSLREIVRNALELYTEGNETVIFLFIPDPALLLLAENLDCRCAIAEPNAERCEAVIQVWTKTGGEIKLKQ